nr:TetM/TetW/TetO/TetS family tetracycline resistance ribosomal protection protein [uncultured Sellimonas sp.]
MEDTSGNKGKQICLGLVAHVDSGKTTLAESILYQSGQIRTLGRVDHKDAFLDTYELEKDRGITIFSKQAQTVIGDRQVTLLDTPGHADFSAEMERTLQVLDYAVLVISGADGVQGQVRTLWTLLDRYEIPVFLFVNKMDQPGTDRAALLQELKEELDERCVDFGKDQDREELLENIAVCEESLLEHYLETGEIEDEAVRTLIRERKLFPCCFGSALKMQGVEEFLQVFDTYTTAPSYPDDFGAKVYKIARDPSGTRLTYLKITGGTLKVKDVLKGRNKQNPEETWEEKVHQIRIYSGASYQVVEEASPGMVCAVAGLDSSWSGEGLGMEEDAQVPMLEPVLSYQILFPDGEDVHLMLLKLRQLEEEVPELHIVWNEQAEEIHVQVMGEVQIEILKSMIEERFGVHAEFGSGSIVYKETITKKVEGVGHFEPLRHYAEVHLILEPGERGSGLVLDNQCSDDVLDKNWQRLILTHLAERKHPGVLTGSEITDLKITLASGRAHQKHTEGGDFRQATYRAVRQGLMKAESILLEPVYDFVLEVPQESVGRAMTDIQKMGGSFAPPEQELDRAILRGSVPVSELQGYQMEVIAYTKGLGRMSCTLKGYEPCHNAEEIIAASGYQPQLDAENPAGSVFCSHGAGFYVEWDQVEDYMHLESCLKEEKPQEEAAAPRSYTLTSNYGWGDEKELEEIFNRTYGSGQERKYGYQKQKTKAPSRAPKTVYVKKKEEEEYLLVDGYNIIFAWEELKELSKINIQAARDKLMDILSNYQGFKKQTLILVFDAYKVEGHPGEVQKYHNIYVVYTKEAETADQYIEKTVHKIGRTHQVTVATSDGLEQIIIMGQGARRLSAKGLKEEIEQANIEIRETYLDHQDTKGKTYLFDQLSEEMTDFMEEIRQGRKAARNETSGK